MKQRATNTVLTCLAASFAVTACRAQPRATPPTYPALPERDAGVQESNDDARRFGGRLYDNFVKELSLAFVPDDVKTPEADGKGGPFGNGTLPDSAGKPMLNTGHDYRLKNMLGWDLHGKGGITGKAKAGDNCVLLPDLLKNHEDRATWVARLTHGEDAIPAYGSVLSSTQIDALVDFLLGVRDGTLPNPDDLFTLDEQVAGFYRLTPGGDAARGHQLVEKKCAGCHGSDGDAFLLEHDTLSLGGFLRSNAPEAWLKILNGAPASTMHPQLPVSASREELTRDLRDLFAAGCDRTRYPQGKGKEDVADGDARCGAHLK